MTLILGRSNAPLVQFVLQVIVSLVLEVVVNDFLPSRETAGETGGRREVRVVEQVWGISKFATASTPIE